MLKDISLGQYFPANSIIHRTDPRIKILSLILFLVSTLISDSSCSYTLILGFIVVLVAFSKIPFKLVLKNLKSLIFIILFTTIITLFMTKGEGLLFEWWIFKIYKSGLVNSLYLIIRFVSLLCGSFVLISYTTLPLDLTEGIEKLLKPLTIFKIHVHDFAMMMSIALRFIPTFVDETNKIISAQKSRGADFDSGGIIKKVKAFVPILIPLFISAFRRASDLADAMECRCYNRGIGHTRMKELKLKPKDFAILAVFVLLVPTIIYLNKFEYLFILNF